MTKEEREKLREHNLFELINKTEAINDLTIKAEPFVKEYWRILKDLWTKPVGYNEAEKIKEALMCPELKELNKAYRELLK